MKKHKYNRLNEKLKIKKYVENSFKFYQIAYYINENGFKVCIDEIFTENKDLAERYIGDENFKVFKVYEDGFSDEL